MEALAYLNKSIRNCRLSLTRKNAITGEGPAGSRLMLVALSPGEKENTENKMFIGPSGQILDRLLQSAGLNRTMLYMTNLVKCLLPGNRKPKMVEIEIIRPGVIIPLGYYATRKILTAYHANPPAARKEFRGIYGHLIYSNEQKILPLPHPSSLNYNPSHEHEAMEKYSKLETLMHDCKWYTVCPIKRHYEAGRLDQSWIELYCKGDWEACERYRMEASNRYHPDWMLPDGSLDETIMNPD